MVERGVTTDGTVIMAHLRVKIGTRKLSASLLVSDPSEYEGGDLILLDYHNNEVKMPKEKGSIIVFDSRLPHKVTPVTTGKRISLVTWMYGPKLR